MRLTDEDILGIIEGTRVFPNHTQVMNLALELLSLRKQVAWNYNMDEAPKDGTLIRALYCPNPDQDRETTDPIDCEDGILKFIYGDWDDIGGGHVDEKKIKCFQLLSDLPEQQ